MSDLRKINIDGKDIEVDGAMTLLQACEEAGREIPRFCYHERLSIVNGAGCVSWKSWAARRSPPPPAPCRSVTCVPARMASRPW